MDKELEEKVSDFIENQDREQLRRLMNMEEERESDAEWKRDYHYDLGIAVECSGCRYASGNPFEDVVCSKHDAVVEETYSCDLYEEI
jgi:hypothetical protein